MYQGVLNQNIFINCIPYNQVVVINDMLSKVISPIFHQRISCQLSISPFRALRTFYKAHPESEMYNIFNTIENLEGVVSFLEYSHSQLDLPHVHPSCPYQGQCIAPKGKRGLIEILLSSFQTYWVARKFLCNNRHWFILKCLAIFSNVAIIVYSALFLFFFFANPPTYLPLINHRLAHLLF